MKSAGKRGEEYFEHFYRIWKVGPSVAERLVFWNTNFFFKFTTGGADPDQEQVDGYEHIHLSEKGIVDEDWVELADANWPTPQEIFIEKHYWEHGVVVDQAGRLRYFMSTFPETFKDNDIRAFSESRKLSWCEWAHITSGHEFEIDPETQIC
jgi:hypothetical protein